MTFDPGWGERCYDPCPWPGDMLWPLTLGGVGRCYDLWPWVGGGVMIFDPGGRCYDLWPWLGEGRCCDLWPWLGGGVVTFDPGRGWGVVTFDPGGWLTFGAAHAGFNKLETVENGIDFNATEHLLKCYEFILKWLVYLSYLFSKKAIQKCQRCQLCVWDNSVVSPRNV